MIGVIMDIIGKLLQWRKELPIAIYYSFIPPMLQILPREVLASKDMELNLWHSIVGLQNMSGKVLRDIRIKVPTKLLYSPKTLKSRYSSKFDPKMNEVKVSAIDPGEDFYIIFFPDPSEVEQFIKPDIIIGDQILTNSMQKYGFMKMHPRDTML